MRADIDWRVYFVTDTTYCGGLDRVPVVVEQAVRGGAGVVQVRDKDVDDAAFLQLTRQCLAAIDRAFDASGHRALLVVNDRLQVAEELGLAFHQGQDDGDIRDARRRLGSDAIIGLSISTRAQLEAELVDPTADVLGLSPIWATPTKTDAAPGLGLDKARRFADAARASHTVVAIGGINASNAADVIATGVDGICVVSAIAAAPDPEAAARELLEKWSTP